MVGLSRRQVEGAGNFFVKQDVAHGACDGRIDAEGEFPQPPRAGVCVKNGVELPCFISRFRMHDQSVFQRQADVVKGDSLEQAGRIEGNVAVGAVDDGGGEYFSVGQVAFPCARDGRQPFDGKGNVRSRPGNFHIFSLFHHGGQLSHGGTQGGVIHQAGAEIEILKLFRAHGRLLGHSPGRPAKPAPARMADAPLGDGVQGFHGGGHIFLWNGGQFKGVPPAAYFNVGVHVLHFRQAVAADDAVLFFRCS